jgi:hypothetical protein
MIQLLWTTAARAGPALGTLAMLMLDRSRWTKALTSEKRHSSGLMGPIMPTRIPAASLRSSDSSVARSTGLAGHLKAGFRSSFAICVMDDAVKQSGESDRACPDCANMANVREGVLSGHPDVADENVRRVLNQLLKRATRGIGRVSAAAKRL